MSVAQPINLKLLVTYSKKNRHAMVTATNGLEAFEVYRKLALTTMPDSSENEHTAPTSRRPEVILMDISMPVMDGFAATREIRAFERQQGLSPVTVVALTGLGSSDAQHEAFVSGINIFLTKPVKLKELTKLLGSLKATAIAPS